MIVDTNTDFDFSNILDTAKWDWTRVSIPYHVESDKALIMGIIVDHLTQLYGDHGIGWRAEYLPDCGGWQKKRLFLVGARKLFTYASGKEQVGDFVQIEATGTMDHDLARQIIDKIANVKRPSAEDKGIESNVFDVRSTRSDSCIDLCGDPALFDTLTGFFNSFCAPKIACVPDGEGWHNPVKGRTMVYGSTKSDYYMRIYEKGHEQRDKGIIDSDLTWIRIEVQVQYSKASQRRTVAKWKHPSYAFRLGWISRAFSALLMTDLLGVSVPSSYKPVTDDQKSILNMFKRSRKALILLAMSSHSKDEFADAILKEIEYSFETQ